MMDLLNKLGEFKATNKTDMGNNLEYTRSEITDCVLFKISKKNSTDFLLFNVIVPFLVASFAVVLFMSPPARAALTCGILLVIWLMHRRWSRSVVSESVLVVKSLGIQLFSTRRNGTINSLVYLEKSRLQKTLILEGFTAMKVLVYLALEVGPTHQEETQSPGGESPYSSKSSVSYQKHTSLFLPFSHFELPMKVMLEIRQGITQMFAT